MYKAKLLQRYLAFKLQLEKQYILSEINIEKRTAKVLSGWI